MRDYLQANKLPSHGRVINYWIPTKESREKGVKIALECSVNEPYDQFDGHTLYEMAIIHKEATELLRRYPHLKRVSTFPHYLKVLPLRRGEFIYKAVYTKTGGVLNLFNPQVREEMDEELKGLTAEYGNMGTALKVWRQIPSELWSELTPQLVWAGGGRKERRLLRDFLQMLNAELKGMKFKTRGECLIRAIFLLRDWQFIPNRACEGQSPINAIWQEREEIFRRKIGFLHARGIKTDFA